MNSKDIRENFLKFFEDRGHLRLSSASLIPQDPTLLFTAAGMVPLKAYFLGEEIPPNRRITTVQKCLRTNDIENVGYTARHHTFFEMLGNFSIGDYFKKEAIQWAYQYVTEVLSLPEKRLWITVYKDDIESREIWRKVGIPDERIISLGDDDNFWTMGPVGPCGPCSEIYFDRGIRKPSEEKQLPGDEGERFLEFWNLVFTQFDRQPDGTLKPLPRKNIDTGMGLERMTSIMEDTQTDFETDLFLPIIKKIEEMSGEEYNVDETKNRSFRAISDHIRAASFLIVDGLVPSNEKRGYVLRRLIRRSALFGRAIGLTKPFLYELVPVVRETLGAVYPELEKNEKNIIENIKSEEERFNVTVNAGFDYFKEQYKKVKSSQKDEFPAKDIFYLYDTLGFPIELTADLLREYGLTFDKNKVNAYIEEQRERARKAFKGRISFTERVNFGKVKEKIGETSFVGYDTFLVDAVVIGLLKNGELVSQSNCGEVSIILDKTPFYAEKGGQAGDRGIIENKNFKFLVKDTQMPINGLIIHIGEIKNGSVKIGDAVKASVDSERRAAIMRAHTSVHILQAVLRKTFGENIRQQGSAVYPDEFRFDFNFSNRIDTKDLLEIEKEMNKIILKALPVNTKEMPIEKAKETGALAFFGEKYGSIVRVVEIPNISKEFCGGTHVSNTSDIHLVVLTSFKSVASGIRRIEGLSGEKAYQYLCKQRMTLKEIAKTLSSDEASVVNRTREILTERKKLQREFQNLQLKLIQYELDNISLIAERNGIPFYFNEFHSVTLTELRKAFDIAKKKIKNGIVLFSSNKNGKVFLLVGKLSNESISSIDIFNEISSLFGIKGGGSDRLAQGSGTKRIDKEMLKKIIQGAT